MEDMLDKCARTCRLCMGDEDVVLYLIHENPGSKTFDMPLRSRIRVCLGISVFPYDNLPQFICHRCLYKVDSYYKFKEDCVLCDHFLKAKRNAVTPLLDREVEHKHEKNQSESSDFEEYEDEPPVIMVNKNNCESMENLADPLALSDTESNSQQKGALDSYTGITPSPFQKAEVTEKVALIDTSGTSILRRVTGNARPKSKRTAKRKSQCKVINAEDIIQQHHEASKTHAPQVAKCTVCDVVCTCADSDHHVPTRKSDERINKGFTCSVCSKRFQVKFSLKRHMVTHSYFKPFQCSHCNCAYSDKSNLIRHQRKRHCTVELYTCYLCQEVFSSNCSLSKHQRTFHSVRETKAVAKRSVVPYTDHDYYTKRDENSRNSRSKERICKNVTRLINEDIECHDEVIEHEEIDLKEESPEVFLDEGGKVPTGIDFPFVCTICFQSFQSYIEFYRHMSEHKQGNVCEM